MKNMFMILLLVVLISGLAGCEEEDATPPDEVVNRYWEQVQAGEVEDAGELVVEGREEEVGELGFEAIDEEMEEVEAFDKEFLERFQLTAKDHEEDGEKSIVHVSVTKPDIKEVMGKFLKEGFEKIMEMAFEGASQEEIDEKSEEIMLDAFREASDITHDEKAELHLVDGEWKIYQWKFENMKERFDALEEDLEELN